MGARESTALISVLAVNAENLRTPVIRSRVARLVRRVEDIFVRHPTLELKRYLLGKNSSGGFGVEEIHKRLRGNFLSFSGSHRNERNSVVARFGNTFNRKMQSQSYFFGSSTAKVLELQNDSEIFSIKKFSPGSTRVEENIRSFREFESGFRNFRTLLAASAAILVALVWR